MFEAELISYDPTQERVEFDKGRNTHVDGTERVFLLTMF